MARFLGGLALAAVFVFVAGLLIGMRINLPPPQAAPQTGASESGGGLIEYTEVVPEPPAPEPQPAPKAKPQAPAPVPPKSAAVAAKSGTYFVQVAAFKVEESAQSLKQELAATKLDSYIVPVKAPSGATLSAVRFGHFDTRQEAEEAAKKYRDFATDRKPIVGQDEEEAR